MDRKIIQHGLGVVRGNTRCPDDSLFGDDAVDATT